MNKEFTEIIEKVNDKDMDVFLIPTRITIPALLHLERRLGDIEDVARKIVENQEKVMNILERNIK